MAASQTCNDASYKKKMISIVIIIFLVAIINSRYFCIILIFVNIIIIIFNKFLIYSHKYCIVTVTATITSANTIASSHD